MRGALFVRFVTHISSINFCIGAFHCRATQSGVDYSGSLNKASNGKSCLKWSDVLSSSDLVNFPFHVADADVDSAENFCRNPTKDPDGPWCNVYGDNFNVTQQICDVPDCAPHEEHCKTSSQGREYIGSYNFTSTGRICQRWDNQSPHSHTRTNPDDFPDATLSEAANFCRNPDSEPGGPWCYTMNPGRRWEYCGIPTCDNAFGIARIAPKDQRITIDSLTDGDSESCQRLFSSSANGYSFTIDMTSTWEQLNVEFAFNSDAVKSCKDSLFFAFYAETKMSCTSQCQSLRMCHWVEVSTDMVKKFCRFTCGCRHDSCQSVTLTVPSQLPDFELCEVKAWSG